MKQSPWGTWNRAGQVETWGKGCLETLPDQGQLPVESKKRFLPKIIQVQKTRFISKSFYSKHSFLKLTSTGEKTPQKTTVFVLHKVTPWRRRSQCKLYCESTPESDYIPPHRHQKGTLRGSKGHNPSLFTHGKSFQCLSLPPEKRMCMWTINFNLVDNGFLKKAPKASFSSLTYFMTLIKKTHL
jgi:hypothetical protein